MKRLKKDFMRVMNEAVARGETPGVVSLVWRDGEEILCAKSGHADLGKGTPMERDTILRLYSLSKPMTAVLAMTLVEAGKLDILAPVSEFLPTYQNQRVAVDDAQSVPVARPMLVKDLFSMTSGLCYPGEDTPAERAAAKLFDAIDAEATQGNQPDTQAIASRIGELPLAFSPGDGWRYGTSTDVLGAVLEVVSGKPLDVLFSETLFAPLGMNDTGFWVPPEKTERFATLYERKDGILSPYPENNFGLTYYFSRPNYLSGGGGLTATADDVLRFARMLLGEGTLGNERIISPQSVKWLSGNHLNKRQMETIYFDSMYGYGYGGFMRVLLSPSKSFGLGVTGEFGWDGWAGSYMTVCPDRNMVFVTMQHRTDLGTGPLTRKLRNILYAHID